MKRVLFCVDGFTFRRLNDYYRDEHPRRARLHPAGLRRWVRALAGEKLFGEDGRDLRLESHFYHPYEDPTLRPGSLTNQESGLRFGALLQDCGFTMHYARPEDVRRLRPNLDLCDDVLLAVSYGQADAVVLLSTQGQYAEMGSRLRDLRVPFLLVGWDGVCRSRSGERVVWKTDTILKRHATSYVGLGELIGTETAGASAWADQLFVKKVHSRPNVTPA